MPCPALFGNIRFVPRRAKVVDVLAVRLVK